MKVLTVVGARPQFIKAALVSRAIRVRGQEVLVHTGQHYDANMSDIFFDQLAIPAPDHHLGVGSGAHGEQTGQMLRALEEVMIQEKPDWVLVYGDTNSTLAGALAAAKLHLRVAHVEAGVRSYNKQMPEEINRVCTDHVSDVLFCPTKHAVANLAQEGIRTGVHLVGDVMYELLTRNRARLHSHLKLPAGVSEGNYYLVTVHRAENTDHQQRLSSILDALLQLDCPVIWPIHPRTSTRLVEFDLWPKASGLIAIAPVGYLEMLALQQSARAVLTDSGGVQKEAFILGVRCITLRDETEWVETVSAGANRLVGTDPSKILESVREMGPVSASGSVYGAANTAELIASYLSH